MSRTVMIVLACALLAGGCGSMERMMSSQPEPIVGSATEADPVQIPKASRDIVVDGDISDWADVAPMPMPFMDMKLSTVHFCWSPAGLYCAVVATDERIDTDPFAPWTGDGLEIWVQKDGARVDDRNEHSAQYTFAPDPESEQGECFVVIPYGGMMDMEE